MTLGRTGLQVGRLGVGSSYGVPATALERAFHEHGVNYFLWGAVRRTGMKRAIRGLAPGNRQQMVIALQSYDRTGLLLKTFFERGLRALRIAHADLLVLSLRKGDPPARVLEAALRLQEQGKVRYLGLSSHNRAYLGELARRGDESPYDVLMLRYNAAHRGAEREIFPHLCEPGRAGVTAFNATRWGHLLRARRMPPGEQPLCSADCYRFALSHASVDLCISGPSSAAQLEQATAALAAGPLDTEEAERVRRIGDHVHGKTIRDTG